MWKRNVHESRSRCWILQISATLALSVLAAGATASPAPQQPQSHRHDLIKRRDLFGSPQRTQTELSPDGRWLAWRAPLDGVMNIWLAPVDAPTRARPITEERRQPISQFQWGPDSSTLFFVADKAGDENYVIYGLDITTKKQTKYTPFENTRAQIARISPAVKDRILVQINNRDPRLHDLYSLNIKTAELKLILMNTGFSGFLIDSNLVLRAVRRSTPDSTEYYRVVDGVVAPEPFERVGQEDSYTTYPVGFADAGRILYWLDSRGRDLSVIVAQDVATGARTVIGGHPKADVSGGMNDMRNGRLIAYSAEYLRREWTIVDPRYKPDFDFLEDRFDGQVVITSRTEADDLWTVADAPVDAPSRVYLYDRRKKTLTELYVGRPELETAELSPMHAVEIPTRDGLAQVSYLTLPRGSDSNGDGRPDRPLPMVLLVHGGPWQRDSYTFNNFHQWLANRGYAVLSPNFRGSTGFGKAYISASEGQWGGHMQEDLIDAVNWAAGSGIAARDKIAIMGGSYGGYATLAGLAFTPDVFACGVDMFGPSHLNTLISALPPYSYAGRAKLTRLIGDPATAEGQSLLEYRSPLNSAHAMKRPLLIAQGANDPRVRKEQSDRIVAALEKQGVPVTYMLFGNEGHGFSRPENALAFYAVTEHFLAQCLGGASEPLDDALKAPGISVFTGTEFISTINSSLN